MTPGNAPDVHKNIIITEMKVSNTLPLLHWKYFDKIITVFRGGVQNRIRDLSFWGITIADAKYFHFLPPGYHAVPTKVFLEQRKKWESDKLQPPGLGLPQMRKSQEFDVVVTKAVDQIVGVKTRTVFKAGSPPAMQVHSVVEGTILADWNAKHPEKAIMKTMSL